MIRSLIARFDIVTTSVNVICLPGFGDVAIGVSVYAACTTVEARIAASAAPAHRSKIPSSAILQRREDLSRPSIVDQRQAQGVADADAIGAFELIEGSGVELPYGVCAIAIARFDEQRPLAQIVLLDWPQ